MTKLVNRAKMSTATTGTGTITLGTAVAGFQSFAAAGVVDGDVVRYVIEDGTAFEIGTGTLSAGTLTRTVSESSNADAALNLTGNAVVYVGATAADIPPVLELYAENPSGTFIAPSASSFNAVAIGREASATAGSACALGFKAFASGTQSTAIGNARASGTNSFAAAIADNSTAFGAKGTNSVAIGQSATASNFGGAAFGKGATTAGNNYNVAIGNSFASGEDAFAAAIANNTASFGATGANSVAIGDRARATSADSFCISNASTASGAGSSVLGGQSSTASGNQATTIGGGSNVANSERSVAYGYYGNTNGILGKVAHGIGPSRQNGMYGLAIDTADATPKQLVTDYFFAGNATNQIILPNNSAYAFHGTIVARQQASQGTACAAFKIEGLIRREGTAASTVLVNSATTVLDNTPGWGMALSADTTNGGLRIQVTGAAATNIRWVATCHTSEVTF